MVIYDLDIFSLIIFFILILKIDSEFINLVKVITIYNLSVNTNFLYLA